jgi:Thiamine pyrophosphate enzyme, N-terminal TPP binding domain
MQSLCSENESLLRFIDIIRLVSIMEESLDNGTTLAGYLFSRLRQLGVGSVFGVPGDYNLALLDYVEPAGLRWVGNCNELNAAYAADGYSRIKGIYALIGKFQSKGLIHDCKESVLL